jgi:hypothetical protein
LKSLRDRRGSAVLKGWHCGLDGGEPTPILRL